jgi:phosphatidylinositol phospholipase C delta
LILQLIDIVAKVEYYPAAAIRTGLEPDSPSSSNSSSGESDEDDSEARPTKSGNKRPRISDSLAALGFYARSMKPRKGWNLQRVYPDSFLPFPNLC